MMQSYGAFERVLDAMSENMRAAFKAAIESIVNRATLRDMEDALTRGDVDAVLQALGLGPEHYAPLEDAVEEAFRAGGAFQASVGAFYPRHERAMEWSRQHGAALIVEIDSSIREAVTEVIVAGIDEGRGTGPMARDIVGTINRATGRREGGIVGLTGREAAAAMRARRELQELDPAYLQRGARDRRDDRTVRNAIKNGRPLTREQVDRIARRYSNGLLIRRGDRIARTESLRAMNAGRHEAMKQTVEKLGIPESAVLVTWQAARDGRTRHTHSALRGQQVRMGQPFRSPSGALMMFPGDDALGAPAAETINCRCTTSLEITRGWNERS